MVEDEIIIMEEIEKSKSELVDLTLTLGNIYSPTGHEGDMMKFVYRWMEERGFNPCLIGPSPDRANVLGKLRGTGKGFSITFNSHMDVTMGKNEIWRLRMPEQKIFYEAWLEGDTIYGNGVVNDKGPLACWLIAADAIRKCGLQLKGDILLAAVIGEIGPEPVDEFIGSAYLGKDFGTHYLLTHGGTTDFAIVAEATNFKPGWVEAGKAFFKITVFAGPSRYTPYIEHPENPLASSNAIVHSGVLILALEKWAREYSKRNTRSYAGGTVIPKASLGAIRGGLPYQIIRPPEVCHLYLDVRILPGVNPLDIRQELCALLEEVGVDGEVEIYLHRPGYEAKGIEPLIADLQKAYKMVSGEELTLRADPPVTSMWRDTNCYAEFNIPTITYGPGGGAGGGVNAITIEELVRAAKIYALLAYYLGQRERQAIS
ncbi:Peptidase M20 [Moorella glycerini]|uniref:5-nitroanthranilic acid aminohydrolase n=1 Tax=Neomoorella stamsii TaxID=1266720 RepID=A0A9X7J4B1_9FIRM|nr:MULTISPECIES: M20/M25/M40 family metallo-hydrolase [Moorella]PRR73429.1 5-nitroanthranilic acid aminohydrolase [Moorella stamsii]CEP69198.1 Peptidase M20 [Moorella glycerini]